MAPAPIHPADEFFNDCGIEKPPVNIYQLAIICDIEIEFANLSSKSQGSCLDLGGAIKKTIVLNRNRDWDWRRRRFTAAHELRHALFHTGFGIDSSNTRTISRLERDANSFAARLLMPDTLLERLQSAYGFLTSTMVSEIFGVSFEAATYRLHSQRNVDLSSRSFRREFRKKDLDLHRNFLYMDIPIELKHWITLVISANAGNKQMLPFCLRCGCPKIDRYPNVCWGCGKDTERYVGNVPEAIVRRTKNEIIADNESAVKLLK